MAFVVVTGTLPSGSLMRLVEGEGLFITSPEHTFAMMASKIDEVGLVLLGSELCAAYRRAIPDAAGSEGSRFVSRPLSIATKRSLARHLSQCADSASIRRAKRAAARVVEYSNSPMETVLSLALSLPIRLGGYGLPAPKLNYPITTRSSMLGAPVTRLADLCWPDQRLVVEYNGERFHAGQERVAKDSFRSNDLSELGWTVLAATREHFVSLERLDRLAEQIARMLGMRLRWERVKPFSVRRDLLGKLMSSELPLA